MPTTLCRLVPLMLLALAGCATSPSPSDGTAIADSAWAQASQTGAAPGAAWTHQRFGDRKPTRYTPVQHQGRAAMLAQSDAGNSTLRLRLLPQVSSGMLRFSWFAAALNPAADLSQRDTSDAVTRVVVAFDGDRSRLGARDLMLSELAQLVTGEPMPYATLMYVWDPKLPVGTVVNNSHTKRIRKLVVESGTERLGRWLDYERDIEADFRLAFGEAPGQLIGLGVMTDANNTESRAQAWYGPLTLQPGLRVTRQP